MSNKLFKIMGVAVCAAGLFFSTGIFAKADIKPDIMELSKSSAKIKTGKAITIGTDETDDIIVNVRTSKKDKTFMVSTKDSKLVKIKSTDSGFEVTALKKGNAKLKITLSANKKVSKTLKLKIEGKTKPAGGKVKKVTAANFEKEVLKAKGKVLVDFSTKWCGYCQLLEPVYKEAGKIKPEYKFTKMDVDEEADFVDTLDGIEGYPTIFLYENGKLIDVGGYWPNMDAWTLIDWIEEKR